MWYVKGFEYFDPLDLFHDGMMPGVPCLQHNSSTFGGTSNR